MTQASSKSDRIHPPEEDGVILLIVAIAVTVLLVIVAVTVDLGSLYRKRIQLQKAVDAAALAGLGYRSSHGWSFISGDIDHVNKDALVEGRANEILQLNLRASGIDPDVSTGAGAVLTGGHPAVSGLSAGGSASYRSRAAGPISGDEIWVSVSYAVPLILLNRVPVQLIGLSGVGNTFTLRAVAHAQLAPANIAVVLDTSGSMSCPSRAFDPNPAAPCECRRTQTCDALFAGKMKIDSLKKAATDFLDFFNPDRDRVALVPFNMAAAGTTDGFVSMHDKTSAKNAVPFNKADLKNQINSLSTGGGTNTCDGMITAIADMTETVDPSTGDPIVGSQPLFMVLFTDGAPTAGRFWLRNRASTAPTLPVATPQQNDYSLYTINWSELGREWSGPSPLIPHNQLLYRQQTGNPPGPYCGVHTSVEGSVEPLKCVTNLGFDTPERNDIASDVPLRDYRQQFYHCAIEQGDFFRSKRGTIFTIGTGPNAMVGSADPYQNIASDFTNKSYFLHRVALDNYHGSGEPGFESRQIVVNDPSDPAFGGPLLRSGYGAYRSSTVAAGQFRNQTGESYLTENDEELRYLFSRAAKAILLRLGG